MIQDEEFDTPEYYDLYDDMKGRLCEIHEEDHDKDKVCCSEDDIKVGCRELFWIDTNNQFKFQLLEATRWKKLEFWNLQSNKKKV